MTFHENDPLLFVNELKLFEITFLLASPANCQVFNVLILRHISRQTHAFVSTTP